MTGGGRQDTRMPIENETGAGTATGGTPTRTGAGQPAGKPTPATAKPAPGKDAPATTDEDGSDDAGDDLNDRHDRHLRQTKAERDKYKSKLTETERKLAEYEARERETLEAQERASGDFKSIEGRYKNEIKKRDEQIAALTSKVETYEVGGRRRAFIDAIVEEGKVGNRRVIEALIPTIGLEDDAPEHFTPGMVKGALKALREAAPELFSTTTPNIIKPRPGSGNRPPDKNSPDYYRELGKRLTSQQGDDAYRKLTGRTSG